MSSDKSTGSWTSQEVLGLGARGIVITKPFECENRFNKTIKSKSLSADSKSSRKSSRRSLNTKDTITKISIGDDAVREYNFMKQLPQGKRYPYAQIKNIHLCKVKPGPKMIKRLHDLKKINRKVNDEWIKDFKENQDNIWQLFMPRFGNRTLHSILRKKQMPMNKKIFYDMDTIIYNKFMTVKHLKNILHHFSVLLLVFIELNGKSLYHQDLKSNNIMCDVDKKGYISKMWIIDFDNATNWNQRDNINDKNLWEYNSKFIDILDLMKNLVREVLLIACSNKPLYDELLPYILNIDSFMAESNRNISDNKYANINQDAIELLDKIKEKVGTLREPDSNEYVNIVVAPPKIPIKVQRMKGVGYSENIYMGKEDSLWKKHAKTRKKQSVHLLPTE